MRLKELRLEKSLYQKDVAAYLGIDRTTYVKYECGVSDPPIETLIKLCNFYSVSLDYLVGRSVNKEVPADEADRARKEVLDILMGLSQEEVQRVGDFVAGLKASRAE